MAFICAPRVIVKLSDRPPKVIEDIVNAESLLLIVPIDAGIPKNILMCYTHGYTYVHTLDRISNNCIFSLPDLIQCPRKSGWHGWLATRQFWAAGGSHPSVLRKISYISKN